MILGSLKIQDNVVSGHKFKALAYDITPHHVYLSKITKHWESFVSHCALTAKVESFLIFMNFMSDFYTAYYICTC